MNKKVNGAYKCQGILDIRQALDDPTVDAISIAAPNHWHSLMTIWGAQAGKHVYVEYGNENATEAQIDKGDGKHVGTTEQVLARILAYIVWAAQRFPEPDLDSAPWDGSALSSVQHFYSEGLQSRRRFSIALPPGYNDPEKADRDYPVIYLLHGKGQSAADFAAAGILTSSLMEDGALPKAIVVFPDGRCCRHQRAFCRRQRIVGEQDE